MLAFEWVMSGGLLAIVLFVLKGYRDSDAKITRIYQRLDETKVQQEEKYTRKEVCQVLHSQLHADISELKSDVKLLLKTIVK